jgi:isopenicillin N synthase-like dioxygenase
VTRSEVPVIDLTAVDVGPAIDRACRESGFFSVVGHGIDPSLLGALDARAREFFALPEDEKADIAMARGGTAWRGWFPVGGELTSGVPDRKEGIYFGTEGEAGDPRPLHGPNLFPARPPELRDVVLGALDAFTALGHRLLSSIATGLGLDEGWFARELAWDPMVLFRIFHYPPGEGGWGVGEHTDYGLLTLLLQDDNGGLEVRGPAGDWVPVPPMPGALVCNLGDMLERMTGGRYRSTPHRVRSPSAADRISCPFFFDPSWDAVVPPMPLGPAAGPAPARWDGADPLAFDGTYGEYLVAKVAKVFPELGRSLSS